MPIPFPRELVEIHKYARPHASPSEAAFVDRFVNPLPGIGYDKYGNAMLQIGSAPILWSCHTDTVHHRHGRQKVTRRGDTLALFGGKRGDCLGADDGAGVWLALEMIRANVPGLYVFHAGEECGGLGSGFIAKNPPTEFRRIKYAVAFDRKGTNSVITHQISRTCSDAFGLSLARAIGMDFKLDPTGVFTDTANYADLIGECSNISVGYEGAHTPQETLDVPFLLRLRDVMVRFDCDTLVSERTPGELDPDDLPFPISYTPRKGATYRDTFTPQYDEVLLELCREYPDIAAKMLSDGGYSAQDMLQAIIDAGYDIEHLLS